MLPGLDSVTLSPPHSPLAIFRLFLTSVSPVIFCLLFSFVDYVPVKGEINAVFFSHAELLILMRSHFFYVRCSRGHISENHYVEYLRFFLLMFSSRNFMVS